MDNKQDLITRLHDRIFYGQEKEGKICKLDYVRDCFYGIEGKGKCKMEIFSKQKFMKHILDKYSNQFGDWENAFTTLVTFLTEGQTKKGVTKFPSVDCFYKSNVFFSHRKSKNYRRILVCGVIDDYINIKSDNPLVNPYETNPDGYNAIFTSF